jgi:hypothetical protein
MTDYDDGYGDEDTDEIHPDLYAPYVRAMDALLEHYKIVMVPHYLLHRLQPNWAVTVGAILSAGIHYANADGWVPLEKVAASIGEDDPCAVKNWIFDMWDAGCPNLVDMVPAEEITGDINEEDYVRVNLERLMEMGEEAIRR